MVRRSPFTFHHILLGFLLGSALASSVRASDDYTSSRESCRRLLQGRLSALFDNPRVEEDLRRRWQNRSDQWIVVDAHASPAEINAFKFAAIVNEQPYELIGSRRIVTPWDADLAGRLAPKAFHVETFKLQEINQWYDMYAKKDSRSRGHRRYLQHRLGYRKLQDMEHGDLFIFDVRVSRIDRDDAFRLLRDFAYRRGDAFVPRPTLIADEMGGDLREDRIWVVLVPDGKKSDFQYSYWADVLSDLPHVRQITYHSRPLYLLENISRESIVPLMSTEAVAKGESDAEIRFSLLDLNDSMPQQTDDPESQTLKDYELRAKLLELE